MADTVWKAGNDGDFNLLTNWTNGVPGTTSADLVGVYNDTSQTSCVIGMDQTAAVHTFAIRRDPRYLGNIGEPGNPLHWDGIASGLSATIRGGLRGETQLKIVSGNNSDIIIGGSGAHQTVLDGEFFGLMVRDGAFVTCIATCDLLNVATVEGSGTTLIIEERDTTEGLPTTFLVYNGAEVFCARTDSVKLSLAGGSTAQWTGVLQSTSVVDVRGFMEYTPLADASAQSPDFYVGPLARLDFSANPGGILTGRMIIQDGGVLLGTATQESPNFPDYNLNHDWP